MTSLFDVSIVAQAAQAERAVLISMKRVFQGAIVATCLLTAWLVCSFYWMPESLYGLKKAPFESALVAGISDQIKEDGVYFLPYPSVQHGVFNSEQTGFSIQIFFKNIEARSFTVSLCLLFAHSFIFSLFLAWICQAMRETFVSYGQRFFYILLIGLVGSIYTLGVGPIWFRHLWGYYLGIFVIQLIGVVIVSMFFAFWFRSQPKFRGLT